MAAWNGWYHVNGNTYGTWLPGDPRGWREQKHKKHIEGDYRNPPPPGSGNAMHRYARNLLRQPPVHLTNPQRAVAGRAMVELLAAQGIELLVLSLDTIHFHLLGRFPNARVRPVVGRAKKHAYFELHNRGFIGRLWSKSANVVPIADRKHQLNAFGYISGHKETGAWVWTFREGLYWQKDGGSERRT
jgi:hypothetical protein